MLPVRLKALVACAGEAFTLNFCIDLGQLSHLLMHGQENYDQGSMKAVETCYADRNDEKA